MRHVYDERIGQNSQRKTVSAGIKNLGLVTINFILIVNFWKIND